MASGPWDVTAAGTTTGNTVISYRFMVKNIHLFSMRLHATILCMAT